MEFYSVTFCLVLYKVKVINKLCFANIFSLPQFLILPRFGFVVQFSYSKSHMKIYTPPPLTIEIGALITVERPVFYKYLRLLFTVLG